MSIDEIEKGLNAHIGHEHQFYASNWYEGIVAKLREQEARLLAAEKLAKYVEKHLNYQDTSVPSLLQAFRAAGKGE